jgi:hypothetical protein
LTGILEAGLVSVIEVGWGPQLLHQVTHVVQPSGMAERVLSGWNSVV